MYFRTWIIAFVALSGTTRPAYAEMAFSTSSPRQLGVVAPSQATTLTSHPAVGTHSSYFPDSVRHQWPVQQAHIAISDGNGQTIGAVNARGFGGVVLTLGSPAYPPGGQVVTSPSSFVSYAVGSFSTVEELRALLRSRSRPRFRPWVQGKFLFSDASGASLALSLDYSGELIEEAAGSSISSSTHAQLRGEFPWFDTQVSNARSRLSEAFAAVSRLQPLLDAAPARRQAGIQARDYNARAEADAAAKVVQAAQQEASLNAAAHAYWTSAMQQWTPYMAHNSAAAQRLNNYIHYISNGPLWKAHQELVWRDWHTSMMYYHASIMRSLAAYATQLGTLAGSWRTYGQQMAVAKSNAYHAKLQAEFEVRGAEETLRSAPAEIARHQQTLTSLSEYSGGATLLRKLSTFGTEAPALWGVTRGEVTPFAAIQFLQGGSSSQIGFSLDLAHPSVVFLDGARTGRVMVSAFSGGTCGLKLGANRSAFSSMDRPSGLALATAVAGLYGIPVDLATRRLEENFSTGSAIQCPTAVFNGETRSRR